ncbi:MAG: hypothetical protein VX278_18330, partial [Myxococcota bacterium]|nr:hypothetical protein [Myxococcota bacterium]
RSQYIENPILFKDLTLYGAVDARKIIRGSLGEVYSMRLRDGRENSLFSYASLERRESYVLDPKRCCVDVERNCAQVVIERFKGRGGLIVLPTKIDNWERIHDGEKRWWEQLVKELLKQENVQRNDNWIWLEEDLDWGVEPCQKKKKRRR